MTSDVRLQLALELAEAERKREPIDPLTDRLPSLVPDDAYEIQQLNIERRVEKGAEIRGHKIGLTSKVMQEQFGVNEPDYGHLLDDMFEYEATTIAIDRYISPRVEIEPAFILGRSLSGGRVTIADVIRATEYIVPAIEIIDSRIKNWQIKLADTIADNGSSASVVLGGRATRLADIDLRRVAASLYLNGNLVESGNTSAVLGNPITAVAWLANALVRHGLTLEEGHVILPGACVRSVPVKRGDTVRGEFVDLGDVSVRFE